MMSNCTSITPLITPYVDGELSSADRTVVEHHLRHCAPCQSRAGAEGAVRDLMRARQPALTAARAPAGLRARCHELANHGADLAADRPKGATLPSPSAPARANRAQWHAPWRVGLAPLVLTAGLVLLVTGAFLYQATHHSARLLAAELVADHVKCFAANSLLGTHDEPAAVEGAMMSAFGWSLHLPRQFDASGFELVGSRRCLYAGGKIAHLMYRDQGKPVSIFMLPKHVRPEALVETLGHEAAIWPSGDRTLVLVTRGSRADAERMASFVKAALR